MQDSDVVAAIVAGDPDGLAEAYRRYAAPLYAQCRLMLAEPDAAQAVQDTFVIAVARLDDLRDPDRLGPWLHAVAHNECVRAGNRPGAPRTPRALRAAQRAEPPPDLREQVLAACTDATPTGRAYRAGVAYRAGEFRRSGFPRPAAPSGPRWWRRARSHPRATAAFALAVVAAAVAAGTVPVLALGGSHQARAATFKLGGGPTGPAGQAGPGGPAGPTGNPAAPASPARAARTRPSSWPATAAPVMSASASSRGAVPASSPAGGPPALGSTPSPPAPPAPPPPAPPPPSQGYLVAAPDQLILVPAKGKARGTFVLTAINGPVGHFAITVPPEMARRVQVTPASGSLPSGGVVTVTVTVSGKAALDTGLTVNPGTITIEVMLAPGT
jgi:Sigma-70 region 2